MRRVKGRRLRPPVECAPQKPPAAHFSPPDLPRAAATGQTGAPLPQQPKKPSKVVDARRRRSKIAENEPAAKAILPEPRSVQKANSYQVQSPKVLERLPENPHGPQNQPAPVAPVAATPPPAPAKPAEVVPVGSVIRIDAGAAASFTDSNGNVWLSDRGFDGGEASVREDNMEIANTKDAGLYRTEHWGMRSFSHPLPNGKSVVKLYFAETWEGITGPGGRVFSFNVEGHEFKNFDVWVKAGGPRRASIETVNVTIADGKLDITFESGVDNPEINGVEIIAAP